MADEKVDIDELADAVINVMTEYAEVTTELMKECIIEAGKTVKQEIESNAPSDTGKYKKSWAVKKTDETSNGLTVVVYSKNRYQLTHLLENGHAKRGGGRVRAIPHIASAEAKGAEQLEMSIKKGVSE